MTGPIKPKRDPLLDAVDALEAGHLTHEQLRSMFSPHAKAKAVRKDFDLGALMAAGLGAARGASFGLGDLAQRVALSPEEQQVIGQTQAQHPYASTAGTLAGGAVPFALTGGTSAAALPGLSVRGTQTAIGAAQGFGLTPGDLVQRIVGAGAGAAGARYGPEIAAGAGKVAGRVPILGGLMRRLEGTQSGFPAPLRAAVPVDPDAGMRTVLTKSGIAPEFLDQAVAAAKKAQVLPVRGTVDASLETPTAIRRGTVVQSPVDQRYAQPEGILPYYSRGGAVEQAAPPPPVQSPTGLLGTQTLDRTDPQAVAAWLKDQIALAESFGQHITPAKLSKLLQGFDPQVIQAVTSLMRSP